jgi:hypothetical protein
MPVTGAYLSRNGAGGGRLHRSAHLCIPNVPLRGKEVAHMSKVKLTLVSVLLVFALSAVAAASASAETAEFRIEGLAKGATVEFAETVEVTSPLRLEAKGETKGKKEEEPTIECKKMKIEKGIITNDSPEVSIKSFDYEGCEDKSEGQSNCKVPPILTRELTDTLEADGVNEKGEKETDEKFKPKTGELIAEFKLEGEKCKPIEEEKTFRIEGEFISKKEDNDKSEDVHNLGVEVKPESGELKYGDQTYGGLWRDDFHWRPRIPTLNWFLF